MLYKEKGLATERDLGLERFDATPTLRAALSNWPFLNVNASVGYRHTYFSESLNDRGIQVPVPLTRQYFDLRTDLVGPVFSKVYTPNNGLADRLKHVIEPNFSIQHITDFENLSRVVTTTSSYDYVIPNATRMSYGLTNRILVRKAPADPKASSAASAPRELASIQITQSYYTDPQASRYDNSYQSSSYNTSRPASSFSPIALTVRTTPTALTTGTLRLEYDHQTGTVSSFSATGNSNYRAAQVAVGWSTRTYSATAKENALNTSSTLSFKNGTTGGTYLMNWDISRGYIIQQRWTGVLQRAVLRAGDRVSGIQLSFRPAIPDRQGSALQHVVFAGRHRHVLELLRRLRRRQRPAILTGIRDRRSGIRDLTQIPPDP